MAFPSGLLTLSKLISLHGIEEVVVCPGSRNAPIIVALKRNPDLRLYSIVDERSAGFFALGRAIASKKPVAICCTSGSAGLNFAPALAEAFYQEIPILALTADRPAEWIDQWDGQTIRQTNFLQTVVKRSLTYPAFASNASTLDWHQQRIANEAILNLTQGIPGPVHLNIPISEPFYPEKGEELVFLEKVNKIDAVNFNSLDSKSSILSFFETNYKKEERILLSVGQLEEAKDLQDLLDNLKNKGLVLVGDTTSNLSDLLIQNHDLILANDKNWPNLKTDLLIHIGKSHVSKRIKQFLRSQKPKQNWLIRKGGNQDIIDTFQSLTTILNVSPKIFLEAFNEFLEVHPIGLSYQKYWSESSLQVAERQNTYLLNSHEWSELSAVYLFLNKVASQKVNLHIGNSLSIRYSNWLPFKSTASVFCNRGTSGIDGTISTYIGATTQQSEISYLLLGDLSFMYDRNGLWNQYLDKNQRIVVINNAGGGIFRNLEGAKDLPELEGYIATHQQQTAEKTALDAGLVYLSATNETELEQNLNILSKSSNAPILLEIFTDPAVNQRVLAEYMGLFKS